jgi:hypothetical protein
MFGAMAGMMGAGLVGGLVSTAMSAKEAKKIQKQQEEAFRKRQAGASIYAKGSGQDYSDYQTALQRQLSGMQGVSQQQYAQALAEQNAAYGGYGNQLNQQVSGYQGGLSEGFQGSDQYGQQALGALNELGMQQAGQAGQLVNDYSMAQGVGMNDAGMAYQGIQAQPKTYGSRAGNRQDQALAARRAQQQDALTAGNYFQTQMGAAGLQQQQAMANRNLAMQGVSTDAQRAQMANQMGRANINAGQSDYDRQAALRLQQLTGNNALLRQQNQSGLQMGLAQSQYRQGTDDALARSQQEHQANQLAQWYARQQAMRERESVTASRTGEAAGMASDYQSAPSFAPGPGGQATGGTPGKMQIPGGSFAPGPGGQATGGKMQLPGQQPGVFGQQVSPPISKGGGTRTSGIQAGEWDNVPQQTGGKPPVWSQLNRTGQLLR